MIIAINEVSDIPIYIQIRDQIIMGISDGSLTSVEQLPTVRALAEEIGVNSMTVSKAYQMLKQEGYITSDRRNGARVRKELALNKDLTDEQISNLKRIASEAKLKGMSKDEFLELCENAYGKDVLL